MWLKKSYRQSHLIALVDPPKLYIYWFAPLSQKNTLFTLRAHHTYTIPGLDHAPYMLSNSTSMVKAIHHFLKLYQPKTTSFSFIMTPPTLFEFFVTSAKTHPDDSDMLIHFPPGIIGQYHYICPTIDDTSLFYLCGIPPYLRAQYQMCALQAHINIVSLCPYSLGFFHTYRHIQGPAFRPSKLSADIEQKKRPISLVNPAILEHIIGNIQSQENMHHLTVAFGTYIVQKDIL
ncbi:MAG TPA: hypothetical protein VEK38_02740 [Candidatus Bathyarchaeia archaeon]|nr:hypothetical protein [Candidatus Bathyarchaeia archaeon]